MDDSLTALGIDHIDLYQVHWPDPTVPAAETAGALRDLITTGKTGHVGVSNYNTAQMAEFAATMPVETLQPPYHLSVVRSRTRCCRTALHKTSVWWCMGPLAHGLLTGTLNAETAFAGDDWRSTSSVFTGDLPAQHRDGERP